MHEGEVAIGDALVARFAAHAKRTVEQVLLGP
jgi:hypothetical protein